MAEVSAPRRLSEPERLVECMPGSLPYHEVEHLAHYLEASPCLIVSPGLRTDPFSEGGKYRVRIGLITDGEWVWGLAWSDYVRGHRVAPPIEFLEHVRSNGFHAPELSKERLKQISGELGLPTDWK